MTTKIKETPMCNLPLLVLLGTLLTTSGVTADQPSPPRESVEEIKKRISANIEKAADRLKMNDPGQATVKTQDEILRDLAELLKQKDPSAGGSSGSDSNNAASA